MSRTSQRQKFARTILDDVIDRLMESENRLLRDSLYLGEDAFCHGNKVLLHKELRKNGFLILGAARSGKSALLTNLIAQRIRRNEGLVCVIDLKGDDEMMHSVRLEAEEKGRPFLLYSNGLQFPTLIFNPLKQKILSKLSRSQIAQTILTSANLLHGSGYGEFHFSSQSLSAYTDAMVCEPSNGWMPAKGRKLVQSFVEIPARVRQVAKQRRELKNVEALTTVMTMLAQVPQLNGLNSHKWISQKAAAGAIDIWDLLHRKDGGPPPVVYCYLRAESDPILASITGKQFLTQLKNGLRLYTDACKQGWVEGKPQEVDVIIDEASYILDPSLKNVIDQGASMGLRFIFATQSLSQLSSVDPKFAKTIYENVGNKVLFTCREPSLQDELMKLSGEKPIDNISYKISGRNLGEGNTGPQFSYDGLYEISRLPGPRLERNHLIEISDTPNRAIFIPAQSAGTTRYGGYPIVVDIPFLHAPDKYRYVQGLPWPERTDEMIVPAEFQDEWDDYVFRAND